MDRQSEAETLAAAWRALAGSLDSDGWRTITVNNREDCRILAGRHFPSNEEAVLVGFFEVRIPPKEHFPEGKGFVVKVADLKVEPEARTWFVLQRQAAGSLEMFTMMAADIVSTLDSAFPESNERLLGLFMGRIRAWQSFMQRGREGFLSSDEEVGLFGELVLLEAILNLNIPESMVVNSWYGPLDGVQDFLIGSGAIEVKTTISNGGFSAKITSLDQLDDSIRCPLFLAGVRLRLDITGNSLNDKIEEIRSLLKADESARIEFERRLLHAGYYSSMSSRYTRKFSHETNKFLRVGNTFPKLTQAKIPIEITKASYELNLDIVKVNEVSLESALESLGVI